MVKESITTNSDYSLVAICELAFWVKVNLEAQYDIFEDGDTYGMTVIEITPKGISKLLAFEKKFRKQNKE